VQVLWYDSKKGKLYAQLISASSQNFY